MAVKEISLLALLLTLVSCAGITPEPTDQAITAKIEAVITSDTSLKLQPISVNTISGIVTLTGTVDSKYSRNKVGWYAKRVEGVKRVKNDLKIQ